MHFSLKQNYLPHNGGASRAADGPHHHHGCAKLPGTCPGTAFTRPTELQTLKMVGLLNLFSTYENLPEAVASLQ